MVIKDEHLDRYEDWDYIETRYSVDGSSQDVMLQIYNNTRDNKYNVYAYDLTTSDDAREPLGKFDTLEEAKIYAEWYVMWIQRMAYLIDNILNP